MAALEKCDYDEKKPFAQQTPALRFLLIVSVIAFILFVILSLVRSNDYMKTKHVESPVYFRHIM